MAATRVVLKIDVDTYRGTKDGIPAMVADLAEFGVRASFYWSLGPDRSGRAIFRVFTKPGFLKKMLRTNAAKMYGLKTALYGTLLPSPRIGRRCAAELRQARDAGHEVGLHAWDHVTWQDRLHRMSPQAVASALDRGMAAFAETFGGRPHGFAAPAWFMTDEAFLALEARGFDYISVSRGVAEPFYPRIGGRVLRTLEIPTTLPTLDEELGQDGITPETYVDRLVERYRPGATEVITVHAETEGLAYRGLFRGLLARHRKLGIETVTAADYAAEWRGNAIAREVSMGEIPGRAGKVVRVGEPVGEPVFGVSPRRV
jgi:undecaprenyl phosphate-alpha-L-ara4FN deformylase